MPANVYECMFLLDTAKVGGDMPAAEKLLHALLDRHHAEILASRLWDERKLAYAIRKHKKGIYFLTYFRTEGKNVAGIEHDCALNEMILRMLILRIDPKWVDTMLALARGEEHATALHNIQQEPMDDALVGVGEDMLDRGPRRPRK